MTAETAFAHDAWRIQRAYLAANSGFYLDKARAAGVSLDELDLTALGELPFTTKDELRLSQEHRPPFGTHLAAREADVKRVYQTSGTSGRPSVIALTGNDLDTWTEIGLRTYRAAGVGADSSVLTTFGAGPFVTGHLHHVLDQLGARTVPVGPGDTVRAVAALSEGLADTVLTTPSFALHLAGPLAEAATGGVERLIVGGEPGGGLPDVRSHLQRAFGATVLEVMGIGDVAPSLFGECHEQQGMHFAGTGVVWPELVDSDGARVGFAAGATGELVYTHLRRDAMPLVRFRSGDIVEVVTTDCPCGRTSFTVRVQGRVDDMFVVRGVSVWPSAVQEVVATFTPEVTGRSRVVLPAGGGMVTPPVPVDVELAEQPAAGLAERIEAALREQLTFRAVVNLAPPDSFGDPSHKTRPTRTA